MSNVAALPRALYPGQDVSSITRGPMSERVSQWLHARIKARQAHAAFQLKLAREAKFAHCGGGFA